MSDEDGIDELVSFLRNDRREARLSINPTFHHTLLLKYANRVQVRQMAIDLVKGLTGDIAGATKLSERSQQLLPELLKLMSDSDHNIQRSAVISLVNLCQVLCKTGRVYNSEKSWTTLSCADRIPKS